MTTSMETNQQKKPEEKKKAPKPQGPIRTGAVVPVTIILVLSFVFFRFFFDSSMKKAMEWTGTYIHGAEVNVGSFTSSFLGGSLSVRDIQVTDKEQPVRNLVQIGEVRFQFMWDALLRAKFVVSDAGIDGIQIYSTRSSPGYVRPPEPPSNEPSALAKVEKNVLDQTQKDFDGNALGDLASLLEGQDEKDILAKIQGELKAEATIKKLQEELKNKEKEWKDRVDKLPNKDEFEALKARAKELKFDTKNPKQFAADLKEASKIAKEADKKFDYIKETSKNLKGDVDKYNTEFKSIDDLIKQDIEDIEARLKIPKIDMADFSKNIFGKMFAAKLANLQKYMEIGRKYAPPPKDPNAKKEEDLIPPPRGAGKNYKFPVTTGYPLFWLKKAAISSKATGDGFAGNIAGSLTNVTTDPAAVGKPAVLDVSGDFPKAQVLKTHLTVTVDHVREPIEKLDLTVGSFPLEQVELVSGDKLGLGMKKASGQSVFNAALQGQNILVNMQNEFSQIDYDLKAKSKVVDEAVRTILAGIPVVTLNAGARGTWSNIDFSLNSNLGRELSEGLGRYVKAKIDEKREQIKKLINERIGGKKEELTKDYNKAKGQVDEAVGSKKAEAEKAQNELKSQTKGSSKNAKKDALKEKGKKLLKGFKF